MAGPHLLKGWSNIEIDVFPLIEPPSDIIQALVFTVWRYMVDEQVHLQARSDECGTHR